MKIITCISFHSTGSSVVDDIFKEFDNCVSAPSDIECRFLQDPDGISDLEYNLIDNPHRLNTGFALKRYLKFAERYNHTYKIIFGNQWLKKSNEYIESLVTVKYRGFWFRDLSVMKLNELILYYIKRLLMLIRHPLKRRTVGYYVSCPREYFYHSYINENEFLKKTRKYINDLCRLIDKDNLPFVLLDQCVPTSNINRYVRYFDNIKVIVVDRDPRDVYIEHKHTKDHVLPTMPVEFCKVFEDQRKLYNKNQYDDVLYLKFEDFIFNYNETIDKLICFVGQDKMHHLHPKKFFDPGISVKNTRLWEKYPQYLADVKIIEKMLPEYLYFELTK